MTLPVLICRPGERGDALTYALGEQGWEVAPLDVMRLEALAEDATQRQIWLDIDQYHKIVVVSPFAAYCLSEALDRYWPQLPIGIDYYSVGRSTASALHDQLGVRVHVPRPSGEKTPAKHSCRWPRWPAWTISGCCWSLEKGDAPCSRIR